VWRLGRREEGAQTGRQEAMARMQRRDERDLEWLGPLWHPGILGGLCIGQERK
jgi:hypothetical protein